MPIGRAAAAGLDLALDVETQEAESASHLAEQPTAAVVANGVALSRRSILRSGLAGVAIVALGSAGLVLRGALLRPMPAAGLRVLTHEEYSVLAAVATGLPLWS